VSELKINYARGVYEVGWCRLHGWAPWLTDNTCAECAVDGAAEAITAAAVEPSEDTSR
jgi:hypothetical protein